MLGKHHFSEGRRSWWPGGLVVVGLVATLLMPVTAEAAVEPAAGIAHRATTVASSTVPVTSIAVDKPAGTVAGDVLVARIAMYDAATVTLTPPGGWSIEQTTASSALLKSWVLVHVVGSSEPASYTFTASSSKRSIGSVSAFSGADPLHPVDSAAGKVNGNSATFTSPAISSTSGNDVFVWFGTQVAVGTACPGSSVTPPAGFTEHSDTCVAGAYLLAETASQQIGAASAQPANGSWAGSSGQAATNITQILALRPAGTPITHRSTSATNPSATATTVAIPAPGGTAAGDVLLARVTVRNDVAAVLTPPTGWTAVLVTQGTYSLRTTVYVHVATAGEPSAYTFTSDVSARLTGSISAFVGVDTARPVDVSSGAYQGTTTIMVSPAVRTTGSAGLAVWLGTVSSKATTCPASEITPPAGFTEAAESCLPSATTGVIYNVATAPLADPGLQPAWTGSSTQVVSNLTQVVVLRRAGAAQVAGSYRSPYVGKQVTDGGSSAIPLTVLDQPSGLGASRINPGTLYVHSEKDRRTMVAVDAANATVQGKYSVNIPNAYDWEDIAIGPCPTGSCIYAADIGVTAGPARSPLVYSVTRLPEPDIAAGQTSGTLTGETFFFTYPGGTARDAESLMVHPRTGAVYVITKDSSGGGVSKVFAFPTPLPAPGSTTVLTEVATLNLPTSVTDVYFGQATAAAIHPVGNRFLLRTYRHVYEYRAAPGAAFDTAFGASPVTLIDTSEGQGEAIDYAVDGSAYYTLSERTAAPYELRRVDRN